MTQVVKVSEHVEGKFRNGLAERFVGKVKSICRHEEKYNIENRVRLY